MLYGGIPEGNQVLLAGGPGSGKTMLAFEYLYRNAKEGKRGLFIALDEEEKYIISNAKSTFGQISGDFDSVISGKTLTFQSFDLTKKEQKQHDFVDVLDVVVNAINTTEAKVVVIDSISILGLLSSDRVGYMRSMVALAAKLRELGVTSLMLIDTASPEKERLEYAPEYFIFDGIICMYQSREEDKRVQTIEVLKMRGSRHSFVTTPYELTGEGFKVFSAEDTLVF